MHEQTPIEVEENRELPLEDQIRLCVLQIAYFERKLTYSSWRKVRCETVMRRKKAQKWSAEKTAKMVRRLMTSSKDTSEHTQTLDQLRAKLSQLTTPQGQLGQLL